MASKLVLVVALLAGSQASPVLVNGAFYRDGRAYAIGQAIGSGPTQASSNVHGGVAQAYGSSNGGEQVARDGLYSGQAYVQTEANDGEVFIPGNAKAIAQNGGYYHVPAPATIVSYQNIPVPSQVVYEVPADAVSAVSRASSDGVNESSLSNVHSRGSGVAISDSQTQRLTSHVKSTGNGDGSATSNFRFNHGTASTLAKTSGPGSVDSSAKSYGVGTFNPGAPVPIAVPASEIPAVIDAKTPSFPTYVAAAPAKSYQEKPIRWHFGTYYDVPSSSANAQVNTAQNSYAKTYANTNQGFANANSNINEGYGVLKYSSEPNYGSSSVNADASSGGAYNNKAKSTANINGRGNAYSSANTNEAGSSSRSNANTNGYYGNSRTNADANTKGSGLAKSSAAGGSNFKHADSSVSSFGYGSANANAQSA